MLTIRIPPQESFDDEKQQFVNFEGFTLELEHSLVSLSKWESKHKKPFLTKEPKTGVELLDYIRAMVLTPDVPLEVFKFLTDENLKEINEYINTDFTATWFTAKPQPPSREAVTSELIYYWMFSFGIDKECENWHLSRLITLVKVFNAKQTKQAPRSRSEMIAERKRLNEARRQQYGTTG